MHPIFTSFLRFLSNHENGITSLSGLFLLVSFYMANYHFSVLFALLTDEWEFKLYNAVILTNIQEASKSIFLIFMAVLADTCLGDCLMLLISAVLYSTGLLIWFFGYPTGKATLEIFLYLSLVLITVGQIGYEKYIGGENEERHTQATAVNDEDEGRGAGETEDTTRDDRTRSCLLIDTRKIFTRLWSKITDYRIVLVGMPFAIFLIPGERPAYFFLALYLTFFLVIFLIGKSFYGSFMIPQTSPILQVFRVFLAAFNKRHYDSRGTSRYYYGDANNTSQRDGNNSGFLDKATLYNPSTENPGTEFDNQRLFTVKQVDDIRRLFKALKLSLVFLMYGVLTSVGDTFFIGQADKMNAHINSSKLEVPIEVIAYSPRVTQELVSRLCRWVGKKHFRGPKHPFYGAARVCLAMLLSVPCFVAAFLVAINTSSNISVFWLMPQLFLIGAMDGLALTGIEDFFQHEMPEPISTYGIFFAEGVVGVGQLLGCLWFICWYSLSKLGGSSGWFGDNIDDSHLDRYYAVMAVFGLISCIICTSVSVIRYRRNSGVVHQTPAPHSDSVVQSTQSNSTDRPLRASISQRSRESNPQPIV